jgi:hypothetical protein
MFTPSTNIATSTSTWAVLVAVAIAVGSLGCAGESNESSSATVIKPAPPDTPSRVVVAEVLAEDPALPWVPVAPEEIATRGPMIRCKPAPEIGAVEPLAPLGDGAVLVRTVASATCDYTLGTLVSGQVQSLIQTPRPIYNAATHQVGDTTVVMWTQTDHGPWQQPESGDVLTSTEVNPTLVAMIRDAKGRWHQPAVVLDLPEAVWLEGFSDIDGVPHAVYWRDSLFEHLLFTQAGRPPSDGLYLAPITVSPSRVTLRLEGAVRHHDYALPQHNANTEERPLPEGVAAPGD